MTCALTWAAAQSAQAPAAPMTMARAFAKQAAYCVARHDTNHPAFHGCVDWHSSVHGVWALTAYRRMSGDARYQQLTETALSPGALEAELTALRADPAFELPYGRAWFLRLAVERAKLVGDDRVTPLAAEIAGSLRRYYTRFAPNPHARDYDSATWALLNLLLYARQMHDDALEKFVIDRTRADIVRPGLTCSLAEEQTGFLSVCVTWAWLAAEALPHDEFKSWYASWDPGLANLAPMTHFASDHDHGKNFSRAWGLRQLARATGDPRLRIIYARHIAAGFADWRATKQDYYAIGHWVAQFGMLAVQPLD